MPVKIRIIALIAAIVSFAASYTGLFVIVFFPVRYQPEIKRACTEYGLDESLVYAVILSESGFNKNARSYRGAVGLMQLMPRTAEWFAKTDGVDFSAEMLTEPAYNISIGCRYLRYLLDKFESEKWAVAAFNAGEGNVKSWLDTDKKIRFHETEAYVQKVFTARRIYEYRLKIR